MPSDGKSSHCLWQGELIIKTIIFVFSHFMCTGSNQILELIFFIVLNKNGKFYQSEQSFAELGQ
jgi:hypothetical protein